MGFSMSRIQREYEECRAADLGVFESWAEEESEDGTHWFADDWGILQGLDFSAYSDALSEVISRGLRPVPFDDLKRPGLDPKVRYLLDDDDGYPFRFGNTDIRCLLRLACELVPADSRVVLDVSDLIDSGYCDEQELICADAVQALTARHPENAPRIVLTEGSTDARILQEALALTKPHLAEYYTFMDFGSSRLPGGAGHLISLVKAFSAAGITNRVIALFDNDTAAHEAVRALESARLLPSIAIVFLPDLELLRAYPTLGPGGLVPLVRGRIRWPEIQTHQATIAAVRRSERMSVGGLVTVDHQRVGRGESAHVVSGAVLAARARHATAAEDATRQISALRATCTS
jgi:hypothetical protein